MPASVTSRCRVLSVDSAGRNIYILIVLSRKMAAPKSKHDADVFDNCDVETTFSLENTTWKRLEEQKHKVVR